MLNIILPLAMNGNFDDFLEHGLSRITMGKLFADPTELHNIVKQKCDTVKLNTPEGKHLIGQARIINDIVKLSIEGTYKNLPLLTFAYFVSALHYFLKLHDHCDDSEPGGFHDDFRVVSKIVKKHQKDIKAYLKWKTA